jgi:hypothetical protein
MATRSATITRAPGVQCDGGGGGPAQGGGGVGRRAALGSSLAAATLAPTLLPWLAHPPPAAASRGVAVVRSEPVVGPGRYFPGHVIDLRVEPSRVELNGIA